MNQFAPQRFEEAIERLALGMEPLDSERRTRLSRPIRAIFDQTAAGLPRPPVERHDSCLYVVRFQRGVESPVDVRFMDPQRRYVPRRLRYPIPASDVADTRPFTERVRRPLLFPGAAYDMHSVATGLRGRVLRGGIPARWARVEATLNGGAVVGRAHGDDRGEFLLLLRPNAAPGAVLENPLPVQVTVFAPAVVPVPPNPDVPSQDPLWDLPLETAPAPGAADTVSTGEQLPAGYVSSVSRLVDFLLGRMLTGQPDFVI